MLKAANILGPLIIDEVLPENGEIKESPKMLKTVYIRSKKLLAEIFKPEMLVILTTLKYQTNFQDVLELGNKTLEIIKKYA